MIPTGVPLIQGVATDGNRLFVTSTLEPYIHVFTLNGAPLGTLTLDNGFGTNLAGLVVDREGDGTLWVADTGPDRVYQLDRTTGAVLRSIGVASATTAPHGLDIVGDTLYLTDSTRGRLVTVNTVTGAKASYVISSEAIQPAGLVVEGLPGTQIAFTVVDRLWGTVTSVTLDTLTLAVGGEPIELPNAWTVLPDGLCRLDGNTYLLTDQATGNVFAYEAP